MAKLANLKDNGSQHHSTWPITLLNFRMNFKNTSTHIKLST
jgi:hypothetical protein